MKKLFIFLSTIFLAVTTMAAWAQENPKLSYQAVVRDNQNRLLTNSTVNVEINILKPNDAVQYTETFNSVPTNQNGLMSLLIGNKPSWDNVDWIKAKINVKITLPGGMGMVESTSDVSAVPLAISALYADSVNLEAVPQSDWDETNPAKCTFIKNKPNIPDTIKNQLADGNSVINHIVDTIADNHIQWATDTLISNRELRDTAGILRGLIHAATGDVGDLAMRVDNFNRHVCDSVKGCVTGWIADSMEVVRDSIEDIRTDMGNMNDDILDSIANVNNHVRDTIRTINTALNTRIDTTAAKSITRDNALQANIDSTSQHVRSALVDTALAIRADMNAMNEDIVTRIVTDSTVLANHIDTAAANIREEMSGLNEDIVTRIVTDSTILANRIYNDSIALKGMIDTTSTNIRTALVDTAKNLRDAIDDINTNLCTTVMACNGIKTMRDSIQTNKNAIVTNATNIAANATAISTETTNRTAADNEIKDIVKADSTDIMKNVSDTASAIRALITGASGDISALTQRLIADSTILANRIHNDSTTLTTKMRADSTTLASRIHTDSIALVNRIVSDSTALKGMIDTTSTNVRSALVDTAKNLRDAINDINTNLCTTVMACDDIKTMRDSIQTNNAAIVANATAISTETTNRTNADNEIKGIINADSIAIMKNVSDTATAIRALITGASGDVGKLNQKVDSLNNNLFDTLHIKYVTNTVLADTIKDVRDSISALRDSMTTNYVSNADLCDKVMACPDIQKMRDSIQTNAANIKADSSFFAGRVKNLSDSVKMNVQAIIDSSKNIRDEISAATADLSSLETRFKADSTNLADNYYTKIKINDTLNHYINEVALTDSIITKSGLADTAKNIRDFVTTNYVSNSDLCNKVKTECIPDVISQVAANTLKIASDSTDIMKNVSDTATAIRALITGASGDVGKLNQKVDSLNNNLFDTLHIKYVTNTVLADTIKDVRDSISALRDSVAKNYVSNADLCDKVMACPDIQKMRDSIQTNAANIKADSSFFAGRVKNLSDSVKMNVQAIIDSSKNIRDEISAATADLSSLETRFKADSANLADNYYTKTKINDTLSKYSTTAAMDARHYLTSDSTIIKNMNDTLAKHNTRISANYRGIIDTANKIRTDIATTLSAYEIKTCADVMACDDIQIMQTNISTNTTNISTNTSAIAANATKIHNDSIAIMKNVSDTATAVRKLIKTASGDVGDLALRFVQDSASKVTRMNTLHDSIQTNLEAILELQKHTTKTALCDSVQDCVTGWIADSMAVVRDSLSEIRTDMSNLNKDIVDRLVNDSTILANRIYNDSIALVNRIVNDSTLFADRIKNLSDSVKLNIKAIADSSKNIREEIKDTANVLRSLITNANNGVKALKDSVEHNYVSNTKLNDTLTHYINEVALTDSIITKSGLADTASAIRSALVDTAGNLRAAINAINTSMCTTIMSCSGITTMQNDIETNATNIAANKEKIKADSTLFADRIQELSDSVKLNIKAIADSSKNIREEIKDTANVLRGLITNADNGVKALKDSVEHNYVSNNDLCDKVMACPDIQKMRDSIQINTQAIIDTAAAIRANYDSLVTNTRTQIANVTESLQDNIDSTSQHVRTALVDTAKHLREAIDAINTSMCTTIMACDGIQTMQTSISTNTTNISTNTSNIAANATKIAEDSTLFAGRIKNLSDSVKLNIKAIADSSAKIRNEIKDTANVLRGLITNADNGVKALKDSVEHNYVSNTKLNDTLTYYLGTKALDSLITKSGLADTAKAIRTFVTTNYVSNNDLCNKVAPCVNTQMKELRDSVNTLYVHTTKAALRDSVAGQIHDSLSTFSSTLHTHANKTLLDTYTQTEADLADAVVKKHEHSNKAILDDITAAYTTEEQTKLAGIADGAEVNVNADWTATSGDAQILNKPTTISGYGITDAKIDMTKKQVIMGTDTLDVSDAAKDGKLTLKVNGDSIGSFSANQATNTEINIKCRQTSVRLKLTEETVDTLSVGMVLAIPTNFNAVDSVDHLIQLYINGVYVGDTVDGVLVYSNGKLTYDATKNDNKILVADERIQVVYWVK